MTQLVRRPAGEVIADVEQRPLITAIVVTRNKESYIRESLCGLMEQSIANRIEVIVVDQGSEQSEWSVVSDLQRRYQNLTALKTAAGKGPSAGLNLALKIASGRYVTVLEVTDRLRNDAYELLAATLEARPDAMLAYGDTCFTAIPHESFANHTSYGKMIWPDYTAQQLLQLALIAPHLMWRRELGDAVGGFDESYQTQGMLDFLLKVVERFQMVHVEEFIGLKLVAAGTPMEQDTAERELAFLKQSYQAVQGQPAAVPLQQFAQPAAAPSVAAPAVQPVQPAVHRVQPAAAPAASAPAVPVSAPAAAPAAAAPTADDFYVGIQCMIDNACHREAADALAQHLTCHPGHARAHNDLAGIKCLFDDTDAALRHYREAVRLNPAEPTYRKNLADLLFMKAGQTDEAIGIYLDLFRSFPRDIETLKNLGIISEAVGQPGEAEIFYQRALEIEPWNQEIRTLVADRHERGAEAATSGPRPSAEALYQEAQALVAGADLPGALRALEGILESHPGFALAHNDLAVLHYQSGAKEQALFHYEKAAALAPENSVLQKNLADFYFVEGHDVDQAVAIYLELLKRDPQNVETLMNLGRICAILEQPQEAETFYGKVIQLEPWNRDARECLSTLRECVNA